MTSYKTINDMPLLEALRTAVHMPNMERYHAILPSIGPVDETRQCYDALKNDVDRASVYSFDDASCQLVAKLMQPDCGGLVAHYLPELRPTNNVFILDLSNRILCKDGFNQPDNTINDKAFPERVVFLCEVIQPDYWLMRITPISTGPYGLMVSPLAFMFSPIRKIANKIDITQDQLLLMLQEEFKKEHKDFADTDDMQLALGMVFYFFHYGFKSGEDKTYRDCWEHFSLHLSRYTGKIVFKFLLDHEVGSYYVQGTKKHFKASDIARASFKNAFDAYVGSGRVLVAAMLLLQLRDKIGVMAGRKTPAKYWYKGKQRPYMSAHTVTISLPEKKVIQRLREVAHHEGGWHNRRHSVRGHWRQNGKTGNALCGHRWENRDGNPDKQTCSICGRKRAFLKEFERGDASLGYVVKQYNVEADPK